MVCNCETSLDVVASLIIAICWMTSLPLSMILVWHARGHLLCISFRIKMGTIISLCLFFPRHTKDWKRQWEVFTFWGERSSCRKTLSRFLSYIQGKGSPNSLLIKLGGVHTVLAELSCHQQRGMGWVTEYTEGLEVGVMEEGGKDSHGKEAAFTQRWKWPCPVFLLRIQASREDEDGAGVFDD